MIDPSHAIGKSKDVATMTMTAIAQSVRLGAIALLEFFAHNL